MELEKFLNAHPNDWEELLAAAPYNLTIKRDGDFVLFKYNQFNSDMQLDICQEARGCIFAREPDGWHCVCYPFRKFFNWQEPYADNLGQWKNVKVLEKVDGSLMKMWCYHGMWFISTNGMINAFAAEISNNLSYGQLFANVVYENMTLHDFCDTLNPRWCYMFELVSPLTRLVVEYKKNAIYFLGARDMRTGEELRPSLISMPQWVKRPKEFLCSNFDEAVWQCELMGANEEGYVCCGELMENGSFARVKMKGAEYLRLSKVKGDGAISIRKIIELWQHDELDDFLAVSPDKAPLVDDVMKKMEHWIGVAEIAWGTVKGFSDRKTVAMIAQSYVGVLRAYVFARLDGKIENAREWFKGTDAKKIEELIGD